MKPTNPIKFALVLSVLLLASLACGPLNLAVDIAGDVFGPPEPPAFPSDLFVAPDGDDGNSCYAFDDPCLTINAAMDKARDGETIQIAPGTYYETLVITKSLTFVSQELGGAIIDGMIGDERLVSVRRGNSVSFFGVTMQRAGRGGLGIAEGATVELEEVVIQDNFGGGIDNEGGLRIFSSTIRNNRYFSPTWTSGGGIFNSLSGVVLIEGSLITGNAAEWGGGISNSGEIIMNNTTVHRNFGGGGLSNHGNAVITNSTFSGNNGLGGRGEGCSAVTNDAFGSGGTMRLTNVTISGNSATADCGAGIQAYGGRVFVTYSTIADNYPHGIEVTGSAVVTLHNSLVADNNDMNCASTVSLAGTVLDSDGSCTRGLTSGSYLIGNPMLFPLADNGGATQTHALPPFSIAVDAASASCQPKDQRGIARPFGEACDIGAYEFDPVASSDTIELQTTDVPQLVTVTPTPQSSGVPPRVTGDTLCWIGPGSQYEVISSVQEGVEVELVGIGELSGWLIIDNPLYPGFACWLPEDKLEVDPNLDLSQLEVFKAPPLPTATFTPAPAKPQAPSGLQAKTTTCDQQNYTNKLTWKDNANNEDGYRVYRDGQVIATLGANAAQYTDNNPGGSGPYDYVVEAFNAAGSASSNPDKDDGCLP